MSTLCILGRQPEIGFAELESLYGASSIRVVSPIAALVDAVVPIARLGGTVKTARFLTETPSTQLPVLLRHAQRLVGELASNTPEGKVKLGISFYGIEQSPRTINAMGLELKKTLKRAGRSVRVVPNQAPELSSAQTLHNQLTSELGIELVFVKSGSSTLIGHVSGVQNIEAYTLRDRGRPKRDTRVGMLPPKLAQIIINLASTRNDDTPSSRPLRLLDPFCGTGVVLQEATLMGYDIYGTDIEERMIRYTRDNINWLFDTHNVHTDPFYEVADATDHVWRQPLDIVACEGYLGTPFASEPPESALRDSIATCNLITKKFLKNIHEQLEPGTRLCIAVPSWNVRGRVHRLNMISELEQMGYIHHQLTLPLSQNLIYRRDDQIVGRDLLVLIRR